MHPPAPCGLHQVHLHYVVAQAALISCLPYAETVSLERHVARLSSILAGIRVASGKWISAVLWRQVVVTIDDALPEEQAYVAMVAGSEVLAAHVLRRVPSLNIAFLRLVGGSPESAIVESAVPWAGEVVLVMAAGAGFVPTGRLSVVRQDHLRLDAPPGYLQPGGPVLNGDGALVGLCGLDPDGAARIVPCAAIAQAFSGVGQELQLRGWIGASLQPVTLVAQMRAAAQQSTGRLVLSVQPGGPAERAGLQGGDILLAVAGRCLNGPGSLRSVVGPHRIGHPVNASFLRNGRILVTTLTVMAPPA
jgi:S1-C subfamily serine protease